MPVFLDRKVRLQPRQAVVAVFRIRNLNSLSDDKQVCQVPNPNFRPKLFSNTKIIERTGHHGFDPAGKETWLSFADEDRL